MAKLKDGSQRYNGCNLEFYRVLFNVRLCISGGAGAPVYASSPLPASHECLEGLKVTKWLSFRQASSAEVQR